jgi:hypothetical protein
MNKNKIKFKYILGLWKTLPDYPKPEDIIYEISVYLVKDGRPNGDFSPQTLKSIFGSNWEKSKPGEVIDQMLKDGDIEESPKSSETKKWYRIKNNTYYTK